MDSLDHLIVLTVIFGYLLSVSCQVYRFVYYLLSALVNKGNVLFNKGDFEKAREFYREALQNDSSCIEALYNAGTLLFIEASSTEPKMMISA